MSNVILDVSISIDGFMSQANDDPGPLHDWIFEGSDDHTGDAPLHSASGVNRQVMDEVWGSLGAVIIGRRTFDLGEAPWGPEPPFHCPAFVVTHRPQETLRKGETTFTFVTDGLESAIRQAKSVAGDRVIAILGGQTARQCLEIGAIDAIHLHVIPIVLGDGVRLIDHLGRHVKLEQTRLIDTPGVTHIFYRVVK